MKRVLDRYTVTSVLRIGIITSLLASFILMGVDLFSNLDKYMNYNVTFMKALSITLLYFPEAFLLAVGPSFLFAVTYHLSMLHASNEIMAILNAGVSFHRILTPIIVSALFLSAAFFGFNEIVAIPSTNEKDLRTELITNVTDSTNNQDIALSDMQSGYMVYASVFSDADLTLYGVSLVESSPEGKIARRTDAARAIYDEDTGLWTFYDAYEYSPSAAAGDGVAIRHYEQEVNRVLLLEPQLFRNVSNEISKMSLRLAHAYLARMKTLNPEEYAKLGTEYYKRIFSCLSPLVMILIACSINYRFKKNVLFFSLVSSIALAVVYFVVQMVTVMLADQGVIAPYLGTLLPFAVIILLAAIMGLVMRRQ